MDVRVEFRCTVDDVTDDVIVVSSGCSDGVNVRNDVAGWEDDVIISIAEDPTISAGNEEEEDEEDDESDDDGSKSAALPE